MAKKYKMKGLDLVAVILVVVGGLNWGLVGLTGLFGDSTLNFVEMLLGAMPVFRDVVYSLVGVAALYSLYKLFK